MLIMEVPIMPDIRYVVGEPCATENIRPMVPAPRAIGRKPNAEPKSAVAGSGRTGGSASTISPSGIGGPDTRGARLTMTVLTAHPPCSQQAVPQGVGDGVRTVAQLHPGQKVMDDVLHRALGVAEPLGDLRGAVPVGQQPQDVAFPVVQLDGRPVQPGRGGQRGLYWLRPGPWPRLPAPRARPVHPGR